MRRHLCRILLMAAVGLFLLPDTADAQRRGNNGAFEKSSPTIGDQLPDVTGFSEDGKEINLRSLKDNYSVVVFGCLT